MKKRKKGENYQGSENIWRENIKGKILGKYKGGPKYGKRLKALLRAVAAVHKIILYREREERSSGGWTASP